VPVPLLKSPELTPQLLTATRRNARHSTGPRSPAAKQYSKLNAVKHGAYVTEEDYRPALQALGEDPQEFENSKQELLSALGPDDTLWETADRGPRQRVRILLKLREGFADLPNAAPGKGDGGRTENKEEAVHSDNMSLHSKGLDVVET